MTSTRERSSACPQQHLKSPLLSLLELPYQVLGLAAPNAHACSWFWRLKPVMSCGPSWLLLRPVSWACRWHLLRSLSGSALCVSMSSSPEDMGPTELDATLIGTLPNFNFLTSSKTSPNAVTFRGTGYQDATV